MRIYLATSGPRNITAQGGSYATFLEAYGAAVRLNKRTHGKGGELTKSC